MKSTASSRVGSLSARFPELQSTRYYRSLPPGRILPLFVCPGGTLMRRSSLVGPLGALAILGGAAAHACACSCAASDFYAAYAGSYAVFLGEALDVSSPGPEYPSL